MRGWLGDLGVRDVAHFVVSPEGAHSVVLESGESRELTDLEVAMLERLWQVSVSEPPIASALNGIGETMDRISSILERRLGGP